MFKHSGKNYRLKDKFTKKQKKNKKKNKKSIDTKDLLKNNKEGDIAKFPKTKLVEGAKETVFLGKEE